MPQIPLDEIVKMVMVMASHYPHAPRLEAAHFKAYHRHLADLDQNILAAAMDECVTGSPDFIPPAPKIRAAATRLMMDARGGLDGDSAWAEVSRAFGSRPIPYNEKMGGHILEHDGLTPEPEWSDPRIGQAVRAMGGWRTLCDSDNPVADRAHFLKIYDAIQKRGERELTMLPEVRETILKLAEGLSIKRLEGQ